MNIYVKRSNILHERVDAIVNPANSTGAMAAGISAAMKNVGSATIEKDARAQAPIAIGTAVITAGYNLAAAYVIHAPVTTRIVEEAQLESIRRATHSALACAEQRGFTSIAFPGMGNSLGQAKEDAIAQAMVAVIRAFPAMAIQEVLLMPQDSEMEAAFRKALQGGT